MVFFSYTVFVEMVQLKKFVQFSKVNSATREVSGVVTAESPDKENEVCDYEKSKPYYKALIAEMDKATDGQNFCPLREMHQLSAVGKGIGFRFDDAEKEIEMTFKVIDDDAWKKCEERVYTGFSQGGRKVGDQVPDPVYKGCMRYVANPSEVSLVDNPCLPTAHFLYVKVDGSTEMRKFLKTEMPADPRITDLEREVSLLKAAQAAPPPAPAPVLLKKTKKVGGKELPSSDFAYVGDPEKTETWKLPVHDAAHARNALARLNQTKGIPASEKAKVRAKVVAAAKRFGVDVASEDEKKAAILALMRKTARIYVNENLSTIRDENLHTLDSEMGKMRKGMYEVSRLAQTLEDLACQFHCVVCEQEWELDENSELPELLAANVIAITETFVKMVDEETKELLDRIKAHAA